MLQTACRVMTIATLGFLLTACATPSSPKTTAVAPSTEPVVGKTPPAETQATSPSGLIRVFVAADESIILQGKKVKLTGLATALRKIGAGADTPIILEANPKSPFAAVLKVLKALEAEGFKKASLHVQAAR